MTVDIFFGVEDLDQSMKNQWDPEDYGMPIFDKTFELGSRES